MKIKKNADGFVCQYTNSSILEIECRYSGDCSICWRDGETSHLSLPISTYNAQYGISVPPDGSVLFVSSWERGLEAFDARTSALRWHCPLTRITKAFIAGDTVLAIRYGVSLIRLSMQTGEQIAQIDSRSVENAWDLGGGILFVDKIHRRCSAVRMDDLTIVCSYAAKTVNPRQCLSFVIRKAERIGKELWIYGF